MAALWVMNVVGIAAAIRLLAWYWPGGVFESATSGTWAALASDFAHGELYRPVLSPTGYGGTRYMPGLIVAYGLLLRAHLDPVVAGVMLMQASVVAACLALYLARRSATTPRSLSAALAVMPVATLLYQKYCTDIRADYYAGAAVLFAFTAAMVGVRRRINGWLVASAAACVLAGLTKLTAFAFVLPISAWLATSSSRKAALNFIGGSAAAFASLLYAVNVASSGRFFDNLRAAMTEGMVVSDIWRVGVRSLFQELLMDPFLAAPVAIAWWSSFALRRERHMRLYVVYLATTMLVTTVILASPGTASNHMVDIQLG